MTMGMKVTFDDELAGWEIVPFAHGYTIYDADGENRGWDPSLENQIRKARQLVRDRTGQPATAQ